jgi:hypothetical protein
MRSILRSTLLASFALSMTLAFSGCEDTTKPAVTPPPAAPGEPGPKADAPKDKMEPTTPAPATEKPEAPK